AQSAGAAAWAGGTDRRCGSRCLFRDAPAPHPNRPVGHQENGAARESPCLRESDCVLNREICPRDDPSTAELDRLPPAAALDRVLARAAVPAALSARNLPRKPRC